MVYVIKTENLSKSYGQVKAVNDVFLKVEKGEIYGFLGVNGAGKSTTIRLLLGMLRPDKGAAYLFGEKVSPDKNDLWKRVGYIVEGATGYPDLTVEENLQVVCSLRQIADKKAIDRIVERLKLGPHRKKKAGHLSTGNLQRLGLAKALIHKPELLILDEPTNGLDPAGIVEIRNLLIELAQKGVTIFISSHILSELYQLATVFGFIHKGKLLEEMTKKQLDEKCRKHIRIKVDNPAKGAMVLDRYLSAGDFEVMPDGMIKLYRYLDDVRSVSAALTKSGLIIEHFSLSGDSLESYYTKLIGGAGNE